MRNYKPSILVFPLISQDLRELQGDDLILPRQVDMPLGDLGPFMLTEVNPA